MPPGVGPSRRLRCWEQKGHRVIAPDLPGHGADATPLSARPYEMYVPKVCEVLDLLEAPCVLVGHSSGGMIVERSGPAQTRANQVPGLPDGISHYPQARLLAT